MAEQMESRARQTADSNAQMRYRHSWHQLAACMRKLESFSAELAGWEEGRHSARDDKMRSAVERQIERVKRAQRCFVESELGPSHATADDAVRWCREQLSMLTQSCSSERGVGPAQPVPGVMLHDA